MGLTESKLIQNKFIFSYLFHLKEIAINPLITYKNYIKDIRMF